MRNHKDLFHEFVDEEGDFTKDFEFESGDKIYIFRVADFQWLLSEYGRSKVLDLISTVNGSIGTMVDNGIAKLK